MTRFVFIAVLLLAFVPSAQAQDRERAPATPSGTLGLLAGAAIGLGIHEAGHVVAGVAFDARPRLEKIQYGFLPFFAIAHAPVSPRQEFVISSAGFWVQHGGSEWILSRRPGLRAERAPVLKGLLAFNLATSTMYGVAALGRFGPNERDTRGMAVSLGDDGVPEPAIGLLVLGPAVLDGYRYFHPESRWARWASRGAKVLGVVLVAAARD